MKTRCLTLSAALVVSLWCIPSARGETHNGPGGAAGRTASPASEVTLFNALSACLAGRPLPPLAVGNRRPSVLPLLPSHAGVGGPVGEPVAEPVPMPMVNLPAEPEPPASPPDKKDPKPPEEDPTKDPDYPGKEKYGACLKEIEEVLEREEPEACAQVVVHCRALTRKAGKEKLDRPLYSTEGTPCSAPRALLRKACARGISPRDLKDGDVECSASPDWKREG